MTAFLSHAGDDKAVALRIAEQLRTAGVRTWVDVEQIRVGESIPAAINAGLESAEALILLISRSALASSWVDRELNSFVMHATGRGRCILPCRLDDVSLPVLIADLRYADFRGSFEEGMQQLLGGIWVAEEVKRRTTLDSLADHLSLAERRRCYNQFILSEGYRRNVFAIANEPRELFNVLIRHGLIVDQEDGADGTFVATDYGREVMRSWG